MEKSIDRDGKSYGTTTAKDLELDDVNTSRIAPKYQGTEEDKVHMKTLGRKQETQRVFTFVTMIGFGSTLIVTWETLLTNSFSIITNGGTAGLFWGFLIVFGGFLFVYASIAELSSMAATASGQYHRVSEHAPPWAQRHLSYITGWLCIAGWQGGVTGIGMLVATIIQGLIILNNPNYVPQGWHGTLMTIGIVLFCVLFNTYGARRLPLVEGALAVLHLGGAFIIIVILWTLSPRNNAHDAFLQINNGGGWPSDGLSLLVGLYPLTVSLAGFDSQVHMSEETKDATRAMPRSIMWAAYVNGFLGIIMAITMMFTLGDLDEILQTPTGYPFIQVFFNATNSNVGTTLMTVIMILPLVGSVIACVATASRQIWSFARDEGVPFSATVAYVSPRWSIPINAILVSLVICILLALINIGSAVALNAVLALGTGSILASYLICISCIAFQRISGRPLPPRQWSLGKWGLPINLVAICWLVPIFVLIQFPGVTPPTAATMNFACLLIGSVLLFATLYWFVKGRRVYISPKERLHRELDSM
ncbi:hypothetical protein LTR57_004995 [Friedmanniomyces endolithicus]|nr:hypothetical protein LTR57_004995 [Friedmanniomyces endolithicus]KAK1000891.1 hypothetical protein LTS01_004899 [Friedmanniomyces endolithicus]